jgi:putative serine protease PepD
MTQLTDSRTEPEVAPRPVGMPALDRPPAWAAAQPAGDGGVPPGPGGLPVARREPRRPGRTGMVAIGAAAAVLSSLLTAGVVTELDHRTTSTSGAGTTSSTLQSTRQVAPLVTGTTAATNWAAVAAAVEPSVVSVQVLASDGSGDQGSGVILDTQGHILTNNHVVAGSSGSTLSVVLADGRTYSATITGTDPSTDLAVLQLKNPPAGLKPATFGDSGAVQVGDQVMAIGNPLGLSETVTTGIVSALNRPVSATSSDQQAPSSSTPQSEPAVTNAIQTDAAINPGNSGGALLNSSGQVIGITSSIASLGSSTGSQSGSIGLGFAITSNEARTDAGQLIATGTVQHAYLGVTLADGTVTVQGAQHRAAVLGPISGGTPASAAGLQSKDAVIAVNGQQVDGADSLVAQIRALQPGTKVTLTVVRAGTQRDVTVTLAVRPANAG